VDIISIGCSLSDGETRLTAMAVTEGLASSFDRLRGEAVSTASEALMPGLSKHEGLPVGV